MNRLKPVLSLTALAFALNAARAEEEITKASKKIFAEHQDAVVWVSAVSKLSIKTTGGTSNRGSIPDQEKKVETAGTVIDPSGLVVTSLSTIDPSSAVDGQEFPTAGGTVRVSASAQIKDVKIIMPDGAEIPADEVMKDSDLDLVFIKARMDSPEAKGVKFKSIDLKKNADGHVLDEVAALGRTGEYFNRQPSVIPTVVTAEMKKPRHYLRIPTETIGGPVFNVYGKILGITVLRHVRTENASGQMNLQPVVLPAADILPVADAALKAKPIAAPPDSDAADKK